MTETIAQSGTPSGVRAGLRWRRAGVIVILIFLMMAGACTGWDLWADRQVEAEIARFEARHGSLSTKTLFVPSVPPADNRARVVRAAAALTIPLYKVIPRYTAYSPLNLRKSSPVSEEHRKFAEANQPAIHLAGGIRTRQQSNWDVGPRDALDDIGLPWEGMRALSDAIYVTALIALESGRADEAADAIVSGLGVSASIRQEPDMLAQLIRTNIANRQIDAIRQLITQTQPSSAALEELARWLMENGTPDGMLLGLQADTKMGNAMLARMEHGEVNHAAVYLYPMTWPDWPKPFLGLAARIGRPVVRVLRVRYLQHMGQALDEQTGPRPRPVSPAPPELKRWQVIDRLTERMVTGTERIADTGDDYMSELGAAQLAVALRRFKIDHGSYPEDLSSLAPVYIATLPIDPTTGNPIAYARQGAGFTLRAQSRHPNGAKYLALHWDVDK